MSKVYKVTLTLDEEWLDAVKRLITYVEGIEVARVESIEPAGVIEDYFTAEELEEYASE